MKRWKDVISNETIIAHFRSLISLWNWTSLEETQCSFPYKRCDRHFSSWNEDLFHVPSISLVNRTIINLLPSQTFRLRPMHSYYIYCKVIVDISPFMLNPQPHWLALENSNNCVRRITTAQQRAANTEHQNVWCCTRHLSNSVQHRQTQRERKRIARQRGDADRFPMKNVNTK